MYLTCRNRPVPTTIYILLTSPLLALAPLSLQPLSPKQLCRTMSTKQKALFLLTPKGQLAVQEKDIPEPGPGEVVVQIYATALNPVDWKIKEYDFFIKEYPAILGTDAAGVVAKVGEGVTNVVVGDKV